MEAFINIQNKDEIDNQSIESLDKNSTVIVEEEEEQVQQQIDYMFNGLNLLCDPRKKKNFNIGKSSAEKFNTDLKNFNIDIDEFKIFLMDRLTKFDINKRVDYYDDQILSCYYHFVYRKIDKNKLYDFICSFKD